MFPTFPCRQGINQLELCGVSKFRVWDTSESKTRPNVSSAKAFPGRGHLPVEACWSHAKKTTHCFFDQHHNITNNITNLTTITIIINDQ